MKLALIAIAVAGCSLPDLRTWHQRSDYISAGPAFSPRLTYDTKRKRAVLYSAQSNAMYALSTTGWTTAICAGAGAPPVGLWWSGFAYDPVIDRLVLAGGMTVRPESPATFATVTTFGGACDPDAGTWTDVTLPTARGNSYMLYEPHRGLRMFGGYDGAQDTSTVLELDAAMLWHEVTPTTGAKSMGSTAAGATYDAVSDTILMLYSASGPSGPASDEIWAMGDSASGWTKLCTACTGTDRDDASIVAVPSGEQYILNGYDSTGPKELAGTWLHGTDRAIVYDAASIPRRDSEGAVYDPDRDAIVVYGGNGPTCGGDCDETWELGPN